MAHWGNLRDGADPADGETAADEGPDGGRGLREQAEDEDRQAGQRPDGRDLGEGGGQDRAEPPPMSSAERP